MAISYSLLFWCATETSRTNISCHGGLCIQRFSIQCHSSPPRRRIHLRLRAGRPCRTVCSPIPYSMSFPRTRESRVNRRAGRPPLTDSKILAPHLILDHTASSVVQDTIADISQLVSASFASESAVADGNLIFSFILARNRDVPHEYSLPRRPAQTKGSCLPALPQRAALKIQ